MPSKLTRKELDNMKPGTIFTRGKGKNEAGKRMNWVAVRGGISDWAIYYSLTPKSDEWIKAHGNKLLSMTIICKLVPCDQEAKDQYRY